MVIAGPHQYPGADEVKWPALNLRFDLRKLSDEKLAERYQRAWDGFAEAERKTVLPRLTRPFGFVRGPVRHPRAYRFLFALSGGGSGTGLDAVFAALLSGRAGDELIRSNPRGDAWLNMLEFKDILDEMKRRIDRRGSTNS
jgi:hypothetical protein